MDDTCTVTVSLGGGGGFHLGLNVLTLSTTTLMRAVAGLGQVAAPASSLTSTSRLKTSPLWPRKLAAG